ncbi:MAG TPA: chorismate-binding protein [Chryseosolibacter sp.]|nr:chorismate-binding protein [Chryseosolibacter sp.]
MNTLTAVPHVDTSETELLDFLTSHATSNDFPFALWQLPNSGVKHLLISHSQRKSPKDTTIEQLAPGFIFAPFDKEKDAIYLPADFLFRFENGKLRDDEDAIGVSSRMWLEKSLGGKQKVRGVKTPAAASPAPSTTEEDKHFISLIKKAIEQIEQNAFEKVVPSRTKFIDLPHDFDPLTAFVKLSTRYPSALVSLVNIPGIGCWMGATPEVLVTVENQTIFKTVALAGTQPFREGTSVRNVAWTQKEIEEQALVERYIISCFKKIRLREYEEHGPKTVIAGNLIHLKSDFTVDMKATNFPQLGTTMLQLLHPTSAVCGMPLESSLDFLKRFEGYDRSFYSGYLGPVNVDNDIRIFVNLRCMQIRDRKAQLYAGAGVTIDSIPEEEYQETEIKFDTLLNVIF